MILAYLNTENIKSGLMQFESPDDKNELKRVLYKLLDSDTLEIKTRKVGDKIYDFVVDSNALKKGSQKYGAIGFTKDGTVEQTIMGNLVIGTKNMRTDIRGLSLEEFSNLRRHVYLDTYDNHICIKGIEYCDDESKENEEKLIVNSPKNDFEELIGTDKAEMYAIPVQVYKNYDPKILELHNDTTNGGISSRFETLLVVCPNGYIKIDKENLPENLCVVKHRYIYGKDVYHIEPYAKKPEGRNGWMFGGNYAATSDGRLMEMTNNFYGALTIHDRCD